MGSRRLTPMGYDDKDVQRLIAKERKLAILETLLAVAIAVNCAGAAVLLLRH